MRRTHLRGHSNILKRLLIHAGAFNLSRLLRHRFGIGTPRALQGRSVRLSSLLLSLYRALRPFLLTRDRPRAHFPPLSSPEVSAILAGHKRPSATGC